MQPNILRAGGALFLAALCSAVALAQSPAPTVQTLDRITAVVNDEVITQYELEDQKRLVTSQLKRAGTELPPADVLEKQLLERMINDRAQLQWAKDSGIR